MGRKATFKAPSRPSLQPAEDPESAGASRTEGIWSGICAAPVRRLNPSAVMMRAAETEAM